jgi:hypothetical protein
MELMADVVISALGAVEEGADTMTEDHTMTEDQWRSSVRRMEAW